MDDGLTRGSVFDGLDLAAPPLALIPQPPVTRLLYRGGPQAAADLGLTLPADAQRAANKNQTAALWLGPDEFLVLTNTPPTGTTSAPHALIDISHRQAALRVSGAEAAAVLNAGCPLDLDIAAFPVDACTRTLFGKAEIVLWRVAPECFHVEASRSFIPYVVALLREAARGVG